MQSKTLTDADTGGAAITQPQSGSPQPIQTTVYDQALAEIENQLKALAGGFEQLDSLRSEEAECVGACEQAAAEEKAILENPNGVSEKQSVEKLLRIRALRD